MASSRIRATLALVMGLVLIASIVPIGAAAQQDGQESDDGGRVIDSCTTITEPGVYELGDNLTNATANTTIFEFDGVQVDACIVVASDDVVLDGNGNTVEGAVPDAADLNETDVSIANQTTDANLTNITSESTAADGTGNDTAGANETGLAGQNQTLTVGVAVLPLDGGQAELANVTVRDISSSNWFAGMFVENVTASTVRNVDASGNLELGFELGNVTGTSVTNLRASDNGGLGVIVYQSHDNFMNSLRAENNTFAGYLLEKSHHNGLVNVTASDQNIAGIAFLNASENALVGAHVRNTTGQFFAFSGGLVLDNASGNLIAEVTATDNQNWTYYSTNGSTGNFVKNLTVDGRSLSFTATDVALRFDQNATDAAGTPLVILDTSENASIVLLTTWRATGASVDVAPTNETVAEAGEDATNASTDEGSTNATASES